MIVAAPWEHHGKSEAESGDGGKRGGCNMSAARAEYLGNVLPITPISATYYNIRPNGKNISLSLLKEKKS
jgi:hypothetical protein